MGVVFIRFIPWLQSDHHVDLDLTEIKSQATRFHQQWKTPLIVFYLFSKSSFPTILSLRKAFTGLPLR